MIALSTLVATLHLPYRLHQRASSILARTEVAIWSVRMRREAQARYQAFYGSSFDPFLDWVPLLGSRCRGSGSNCAVRTQSYLSGATLGLPLQQFQNSGEVLFLMTDFIK